MNPDDRISRYLEGRAELLELAPSGPNRAARRARQRQARRRLGGVAAVGLAAVLVTTQVVDPAPHQTVVADQPGAVHFDGAPLSWQRQDPSGPDTALGYNDGIVLGGSSLYALSTEPGHVAGDQTAARAVYRSSDGSSWTTTGALPADRWFGQLTAEGGNLYAVSTGAGQAGGIGVSTSTDGGSTWGAQDLPIDLAGIAAHSTNLYVSTTSLAASDGTVVAAVRVSADVDASILPAGTSAPDGVHATAAGVEVLGPVLDGQPLFSPNCTDGTVVQLTDGQLAEMAMPKAAPPGDRAAPEDVAKRLQASGAANVAYGCQREGDAIPTPLGTPSVTGAPVRTVSWDELGASTDVRLAATSTLRAFVSTAGGAFREVTLPVAVEGYGTAAVLSTPAGFTLVAQAQTAGTAAGAVHVLTSTDGVTWAESSTAPALDWVTAVGRIGDQIGIVSQAGKGNPELTLGDGTTWTTELLPGNAVASAAFGPAGVAIASFQDLGAGAVSLLTSADGHTWTTTEGADLPVDAGATLRHLSVTASGVVATFDVPPGEGGGTPGTEVVAASLG
jgi:hypothetical protein